MIKLKLKLEQEPDLGKSEAPASAKYPGSETLSIRLKKLQKER